MAAPLSITHVGKFYPPHVGGIEIHLETLCRALGRWHEVNVIVANESRRHREEWLAGVRIMRLPNLGLSSTPVCPRMAAVLRALRSDIVHIHLPNPPALLAYLMSRRRGPLILTWHSDIVRQKVGGRALLPLHRWFVGHAACCIATSPDYIHTSPILAGSRERCRVIPYGIEIERFVGHSAAAAELRRLHGARIVLAVGRLIYYKGFEYLLRAMARVNARLIIVGDGPLRTKLERLAAEMGIGGRIFFAGEIPNSKLGAYYHAADLFVLPSVARSEAFGIVQLEAMACGKPIVNTRLDSGVPSVSLDGVTGITVPPRDPLALAQAINCLLDNAGLRTRYGAAALCRVRAEFTLEQMVRRTLALYREILSEIRPTATQFSAKSASVVRN